jgi:hypothetical protein
VRITNFSSRDIQKEMDRCHRTEHTHLPLQQTHAGTIHFPPETLMADGHQLIQFWMGMPRDGDHFGNLPIQISRERDDCWHLKSSRLFETSLRVELASSIFCVAFKSKICVSIAYIARAPRKQREVRRVRQPIADVLPQGHPRGEHERRQDEPDSEFSGPRVRPNWMPYDHVSIQPEISRD